MGQPNLTQMRQQVQKMQADMAKAQAEVALRQYLNLPQLAARYEGDETMSKAVKATNKRNAKKGKPAVKAAKEKKGGGKRTSARTEMKIRLLEKTNPKREGTNAHKLYAKYKTGMTVADALAAGMPSNYISYDVRHKYIELYK